MAIINPKLQDNATKNLTQIQKQQLSFIIAKTLTRTAKKAQEETRRHINFSTSNGRNKNCKGW